MSCLRGCILTPPKQKNSSITTSNNPRQYYLRHFINFSTQSNSLKLTKKKIIFAS